MTTAPDSPDPDLLPSTFVLSIGGYSGASYDVAWNGAAPTYRSGNGFGELESARARTIEVPPERWRTFWARLEKIGVWEWNDRYSNPGIVDGTSWRVNIRHGDKELTSAGSNAYPESEGDDATDPFSDFVTAVKDLLDEDFG